MVVASVGVGTVVGVLLSAFVTGALARLAVPGPDPMPIWLTIAIGLAGSLGGGGIAYAAGWRSAYGISTVGFVAAIALVIGYRRFIQRRPIVGRGAYRFPERGFGIDQYRKRLQNAGIDPDKLAPLAGPFGQPAATKPDAAEQSPPHGAAGDPTENPAHYLGLLEELHDSGVLDDEEYSAARTRLLEKLRS
ncbi:MAG TPA: SHOCT domain-containing protein [Gaiellaceae bacterium]